MRYDARSCTQHRGWCSAVARLAALCALAASAASLSAQPPNARALLPGYDVPILLDTLGIARPISGNRDSIFVALTAVFAELGIPVQRGDATTGLLNNLNADISRRLGNVPLSRYLECGRGFSGNNADFYRITLALSAWVEPASGPPQRLLVAVAASGRDPSGSRSAYSVCTSKGALELLVARRVQEIIAKGT